MNVWVYSIVRNRAELVPFFLRHYGKFAERLMIWDDHSNDGTRELFAQHTKVRLHDWPYDDGINEDQFLKHAYAVYPLAEADWVMWVDLDEFLYAPDPMAVLKAELDSGTEVIRTEGFNMTADKFPKDDGKSQLWELVKTGVPAPVYSKPVILRPSAKVRWNRGKHDFDCGVKPRLSRGRPFKLLHYRYMGYEYTKMRNAQNYERCGFKSGDKGPAWTCAPDYHGEHSADWAGTLMRHAINVIEL